MPLAVAITALYVSRFTLELVLMDTEAFQQRYAKPGIIVVLKDIMYGLIYPAVLGTELVFIALRVAKEPSIGSGLNDAPLYVGAAASLFYILSFTALSEKRADKESIAYRGKTFFCDVAEVFLMFGCFNCLGLLQDAGDHAEPPRLALAYLFLFADVTLIQYLWRLFAGVDPRTAWEFRVPVAAALIVGIAFSIPAAKRFAFLHPGLDIGVAVVVAAFVVAYVVKDKSFWREEK